MNPGDLVFLDAQVLGLLTHPRAGDEPRACRARAKKMIAAGVRLFIPEIADYELRRELVRRNRQGVLRQLDLLRASLDFAPITSPAIVVASNLWAECRARGRPPTSDIALDADVILAAQALQAAGPDRSVVVASANVKHLGQFLDTRPWDRISLSNPSDMGRPDPSCLLMFASNHMA